MLISNEELKNFLDTRQNAQVIRWLNAHRVRWWRDAKRQPVTTVGEIERAKQTETDEVDF